MKPWFKLVGTGAILIAPVCVGYVLGLEESPRRPPNLWTVEGVAALILLLMGWSKAAWRPSVEVPPWVPVLCGFLALYAAGILVADPFVSPDVPHGLPWRGLLLLPFVISLPILVGKRLWLSMLGIALFLAAATAVLTYNVRATDSGIGFLRWWP